MACQWVCRPYKIDVKSYDIYIDADAKIQVTTSHTYYSKANHHLTYIFVNLLNIFTEVDEEIKKKKLMSIYRYNFMWNVMLQVTQIMKYDESIQL